jgi:hypothetical protein
VIFAKYNKAVNISRVMGLSCLAIFCSLYLDWLILVHIFAQSDKSAGVTESEQSVYCHNVFVIKHELLNKTCNNSHVTLFDTARVGNTISLNEIYVDSLTACLNLVVSSSESDSSLDSFASTIFLGGAWDSAGRKCRLEVGIVVGGGGR